VLYSENIINLKYSLVKSNMPPKKPPAKGKEEKVSYAFQYIPIILT